MSAPAPVSASSGSTLAAPTASNGSGGSRPSSAGGAGMLPLANPFVEFESLGVIGRGKYSEVHKVSRNTEHDINQTNADAVKWRWDTHCGDGGNECDTL